MRNWNWPLMRLETRTLYSFRCSEPHKRLRRAQRACEPGSPTRGFCALGWKERSDEPGSGAEPRLVEEERMRPILRFFAVLSAVGLAAPALAQVQTGSILVRAADEQGAVMPGVAITIS